MYFYINKIYIVMKYFIKYNGIYIAERRSIKACLILIGKKSLKDDENNELYIVDEIGNYFNSKGEYIELI